MAHNASRTVNSVRNIFVSISCQFLTLIFSFLSRTVFIKFLGAEYLGINGLFSNILSIMSLADLGFGTAVVYALYKPLADNDTYKVTQIINYFKKIYNLIALIIFIIGVSLIPFLQYFVNLDRDIPYLRFYYFLYLLETVCSYLVVYKSALLNADQCNYIVKIIRTIFNIISHILKLIFLFLTKSFTVYVLVGAICVIASNFVIQIIANKNYKFLNNKVEKLEKSYRKDIMDNVKSLFLYRIGGVILNNTDNILISTLVNTISVGFYSNYSLLFGTVTTFSQLIFGSLNSSVGNQYVNTDKNKVYDTFKMLNFANFWVYGFCCITLYCLMSDFITIWLGSSFVFDDLTVFVICLNIYVSGMLSAVVTVRSATGMFKKTKYVFLITAAFNIIFSIIFGKMFGIVGIIGATILSRLLTNVWYEPFIIHKHVFKKSYYNYILTQIKYLALFVIPCLVITVIKQNFRTVNLFYFVCELILCVIVINLLFYIVFRKTKEFKGIKNRVENVINKKVKKSL